MVTRPQIDIDEFVRDNMVNSRVYTDPRIFELEIDKIFNKTWVYVAHESEVAEGGDYKSTYLGRHPVIVARSSDDGSVNVFLNRCRHRGATVCQQQYGNANYFRCAYHGWVYDNNGSLAGVPFEEGYGEDFDKPNMGLVKVPRVDSYQGFIFASLSPDGPSLSDHLGKAKPYIDRFVALGPDGIELKAGLQKFGYDGNWKMQLENTVDGYHAGFVHQSYMEIVAKRTGVRRGGFSETAATRDLGNGHGLLDFGDMYGQAGGSVMAGPGFNMTIFPNLALLFSQVRHIIPMAHNRTEITLYSVRLKGVSAEINTARLRDHEEFYGPGSFAAPDDWEVFARCQTGFQANEPINNADWILLSRGLHYEQTGENGIPFSGIGDETSQRALYRHYRRVMSEE